MIYIMVPQIDDKLVSETYTARGQETLKTAKQQSPLLLSNIKMIVGNHPIFNSLRDLIYLFTNLKINKFSVRLLSVLRGHSILSYPPQRPMTSDFEGFSIPDFIHYIYFPILILEKEPVFSLLNVQC